MLLVMASIGAGYHDDDATASSLCRIARASLMAHIGSTPHTIADEPLWVLQCLLMVMIQGSKHASFQHYQEAISLASLLIEGVRYRKCHPYAHEIVEGEFALLEQWHKWVEIETTIRTIWATYVYLSAIRANFETAYGLTNQDINDCFLPCDENEWMSTTPKLWLATRQSNAKPSVRFSTAMASLSSPQSGPPLKLNSFGLYVMLHGVTKQLASVHQDAWLLAATSTLEKRYEQALDRWRISAEQTPECRLSPRYPSGVIAANALSLYRQACVRLYADFGPLRLAFATRDVQTILRSIQDTKIVISSSNTCLRAARCAIEAFQTSVKMGLCLTDSISGWHHKLWFNLYSVEGCLFLSVWIREQLNRPAYQRSSEENELVTLTQETLREVNLNPALATKPCSVKLVHAWALVFQLCTASGLHSVIAKVLGIYADGLAE